MGRSVGRYVPIEVIGEGGMGLVLRAYDPKLEREVALKLVRTDAMGPDAQTRLVLEARAMARLSHPNVVAVYDVELDTDEGVVIVMEYVPGVTLRKWLEVERPWREVVEAFCAAGQGLAAAHREGLLHRDFKPGNVLVARDGRVRVTDFGLARHGSSDSTDAPAPEGERSPASSRESGDVEKIAITRTGLVMGTPSFMAPEQHAGTELGAAADQYAFCVALWRALSGELPFAGRGPELLRLKRESRPVWPERAAVPRRVVDALKRGLQPDPAGRWPAIEELLRTLTQAARPRRSPLLAAVFGLAVLGGVLAWPWLQSAGKPCTGAYEKIAETWDEARRKQVETGVLATEASFAAGTWQRIEPMLDAYADAWAVMHTDACEATTVRGEQSAEVMDRRIACLHDARMHLHAALGVLADADANVVKRAHDLVADLPDVAACADVEALLADVAPPMPEQAAEVDAARALVAEAHAVTKAGRPREAAEILEGVLEQAAEIGYTPLVVDAEYELGMTRLTLGEAEAAEQVLTSALRAAIAGGQWSTAASVAVRIVYSVGLMQHRLAEAKTLTSVAWGLVERGGDATDELDLRMALALTLQEEGKYAEAMQELRSLLARAEQIVGSDHPVVALAHMNLGNLHGMQGQLGDAEVEHQHVLEIRERTVGPDHPQTADARLGLGNVYFLQGRFERAEAAYERVRAVWEAAYGLENADVAMVYSNLGNLFRHQERWEEAERATVQALEIRERVHGLDAPETADSVDNVAALHASRRRWGEAAASFRRALEIRRKVFGAEHPRVALSLVNLAQVQAESRPGPEAVRMAEEALAMSERVQASPAEVGRALFVLAEAVWDAEHDVTRARELVLRAREAYAAGDGGDLHALEALARELGDG